MTITRLNLTSVLAITALMAGCASTKPLPDGQYTEVASNWSAIHNCGSTGQMPPQTAALGKQMVQRVLASHTYDAHHLNYLIKERARDPVSQTQCNELAMSIYKAQGDIAGQNAAAAADQKAVTDFNNSIQKPIYCNRIGTQVFCN